MYIFVIMGVHNSMVLSICIYMYIFLAAFTVTKLIIEETVDSRKGDT